MQLMAAMLENGVGYSRKVGPVCIHFAFEHPPYNPDVVPSDYLMFLCLKRFLGGQSLQSGKETNIVVQE